MASRAALHSRGSARMKVWSGAWPAMRVRGRHSMGDGGVVTEGEQAMGAMGEGKWARTYYARPRFTNTQAGRRVEVLLNGWADNRRGVHLSRRWPIDVKGRCPAETRSGKVS